MKKFMKRIDIFCYKHPRFGIPNLMLFIVIGNLAVWLFSAMDSTGLLVYNLAFSAERILNGQIWRLLTFVFVPQSGGISLLLFLYFYYFIGSTLEREWGAGRFTVYYLFGMLLTIIYGFVTYFITGNSYPITADYINLSMFFAFATLFPDMQVLLFFIIPIKMKWLAIVDALYFAYEIFAKLGMGYGMMSFLPIVALLNYFLFCGDELFSIVMPRGRQQRKKTVNFKREVAKIKHETKNKPYTRKCSVCGRTDADFPQLEFRYCSRCEGYHCFCEEHINNHVHFTE
ncbi:MAG: hypothetical protein RR314_03230 [Oscillospiraceae bacterium]